VILIPRLNAADELVGLLATQVADIRELPTPPAGSAGGPLLGPPIADGTSILRLLDPDYLLASLESLPGPQPRPGIGP
jgi:hypothetical protein